MCEFVKFAVNFVIKYLNVGNINFLKIEFVFNFLLIDRIIIAEEYMTKWIILSNKKDGDFYFTVYFFHFTAFLIADFSSVYIFIVCTLYRCKIAEGCL